MLPFCRPFVHSRQGGFVGKEFYIEKMRRSTNPHAAAPANTGKHAQLEPQQRQQRRSGENQGNGIDAGQIRHKEFNPRACTSAMFANSTCSEPDRKG